MRTLNLATDTFDRVNTFTVEVRSVLGRMRNVTASLHRDMEKRGDGILWIMQHSAMIASSYSDEQIAERKRLNEEEPIRNGEVVIVEGKTYRVNVNGDYSNCAVLTEVTEYRYASNINWGDTYNEKTGMHHIFAVDDDEAVNIAKTEDLQKQDANGVWNWMR